ncbi:MAG: sugar ABC transporter permease [Thermaceae bacterium]|nr:sugar ABC transporter permease [Thermaceae bacterium]
MVDKTSDVRAIDKKREPRKRIAHLDYLFVAPAALFLLLFMVYPVLFNISLSLRDVTAATLLDTSQNTFVGLSNYAKVFQNPAFATTVINTLVFTFFSLVFQLGLGMALAIFYTRSFPGARYMRGLYLVAWTIPIVVSGSVFRWLLEGDAGVINYLLRTLGLIHQSIFWISNPNTALVSVIFVNIWLGLPFNLTLLIAALQGLPQEVYEAASIDGASGWQKYRFVTLPMLRPALLSIVVLGLIYTFKVFDLVFIVTGGGPLNASDVVSTLAYKMVFRDFLFGQGAAILNLLFVVLFVLSLFYIRTTQREEV